MNELIQQDWLPFVFFILFGLAVLMYAVLDGYDLGVGILLPLSDNHLAEQKRDTMIASIGPFWDANETWLVLAVGLLLIAFPAAHNIIFEALYLPTLVMLIGLILRGVSFDFRAKSVPDRKYDWDRAFKFGSVLSTLAQGYMLGMYVAGFDQSTESVLFALISAVCVTTAYAFIGGAWLVMKTDGELQQQAVRWTRVSARFMAFGVAAVTVVNLWLYPAVVDRWFELAQGLILLPLPLACGMLFVLNDQLLKRMPFDGDAACWIPFFTAVSIFVLTFFGLGFSFFPYIIPNELTIWEAASARESLSFLLWGAAFVIPAILAYTAFSYRVFWGKARELEYY